MAGLMKPRVSMSFNCLFTSPCRCTRVWYGRCLIGRLSPVLMVGHASSSQLLVCSVDKQVSVLIRQRGHLVYYRCVLLHDQIWHSRSQPQLPSLSLPQPPYPFSVKDEPL